MSTSRDWFLRLVLAVVSPAGLLVASTLIQGCAAVHRITIEDERTVAWVPLNNTFAGGGRHDTSGNEIRPFWTGLLFHLGKYEHPDVTNMLGPDITYIGVAIEAKDGKHHFAAPAGPGDPFFWFNVVPEEGFGTSQTSPLAIEGDHPFFLFPNAIGLPPEGCYDPPDCDCACDNEHVRRVNPRLDPVAMLTLWQGPKGYTVAATPRDRGHNSFEVQIPGDLTVEVYTLSVNGMGGPEAELVTTLRNVKTIQVLFQTNIQHGEKMDPPWP